MKTKKILALLLAILIFVSLALSACGNEAVVKDEEKAVEEEVVTVDETEVEEVEKDFTRFEETQNINVLMMSWGDWEGFKEVEEEVNKISEELLNIHVDITQMNTTAYREQAGLMLSAGETIDLMMYGPFGSSTFLNMLSLNQMYDVTDLLPVYGKDILEVVGNPEHNYLAANTVDGKVYGIPAYRMYTTKEWLFMRRDILEHLGITEQASQIDSWSDLEAILKIVYEAQDTLPIELQTNTILGCQNKGEVIAMNGGNYAADAWADCYAEDYLGAMYIGCDPETDTVFCNFTTDDARTHYDRLYDWSEKGYIYKEAATSDVTSENLMSSGATFAYFANGEYGTEAEKSKTTGFPLMAIECAAFPVTNAYVQTWGWTVPYCTENPEAAVAFLNLMYSNKDISNLLVWGIQGRDYDVNEIGEAYRLEDTLKYQAIEFFYGNQFNAHGSVGQGPTIREEQLADNNAGRMSKYFGLTIDTAEIANEMVAVQSVIDQYFTQLASGSVSSDVLWDDFLQAMDDAGIQIIIDFYQAKVDEFVAKK